MAIGECLGQHAGHTLAVLDSKLHGNEAERLSFYQTTLQPYGWVTPLSSRFVGPFVTRSHPERDSDDVLSGSSGPAPPPRCGPYPTA
ncbi:hypothetical protein KESI111651_02890 [Kerstersia similis]